MLLFLSGVLKFVFYLQYFYQLFIILSFHIGILNVSDAAVKENHFDTAGNG